MHAATRTAITRAALGLRPMLRQGLRFRRLLLGVSWFIALPLAVAQPPALAAPVMPDAGISAVRNQVLAGLQAMPELDPRAAGAVIVDGRCTLVMPCRTEAVSAISAMPPLRVNAIACEIQVTFEGRAMVMTNVEGLGRGASCMIAQRDAPLQVAGRLLPLLRPEVLAWSRKRRLAELSETLERLDRGTAKLQGGASAVEVGGEAALRALDEALRGLGEGLGAPIGECTGGCRSW